MTARLLVITWTAGPLARHVPLNGDAVALVRPYVLDGPHRTSWEPVGLYASGPLVEVMR